MAKRPKTIRMDEESHRQFEYIMQQEGFPTDAKAFETMIAEYYNQMQDNYKIATDLMDKLYTAMNILMPPVQDANEKMTKQDSDLYDRLMIAHDLIAASETVVQDDRAYYVAGEEEEIEELRGQKLFRFGNSELDESILENMKNLL